MLPPRYQKFIRTRCDRNVPFAAIIFQLDRGVISSSTVKRAIARLEAEGEIIAIGNDFTIEAQDLLRARRVGFISLEENVTWTDESYKRIRVLIGAKVKRPPKKIVSA